MDDEASAMTRLFPAMTLAVLLGAVPAANAQGPFQRLFGAKTPAPKSPQDEAKRQAEIAVERAWMADPATFPYYLEAKAEGATLHVRGYVPDKAVRDQALRIAR